MLEAEGLATTANDRYRLGAKCLEYTTKYQRESNSASLFYQISQELGAIPVVFQDATRSLTENSLPYCGRSKLV